MFTEDCAGVDDLRTPSREAAKECSPRRKPWLDSEIVNQPRRGERNSSESESRRTETSFD